MKIFSCKNTKRSLKAFSLGEVMLAAFVLTAGIVAAVALISKSITYTYNNRDVIIAAELSQEGLELVRNIRDNDLAAGNNGFTGFSSSDKHCRTEYDQNSLLCWNSQGSPSSRGYNIGLYSGRFEHIGSPQRFKRYLYVDYNSSQKTARVVSYVFWGWNSDTTMPSSVPSDGGTGNCTITNKCVFSEAFLTEWRK